MTDKMTDKIKHLVSKKKRRFIEDGFDLDLAYIKPNIIAMGFPSEKLEGVYRNHLDDVLRFLELKHKDRYKVYNLCSEKYYDPAKFGRRVSHYGFDDHNAPPFELILPCCIDMDKWLDANAENVAIIHCKAGKGRTGVMICAYLLHKKYFTDALEAMNYYADARTENKKGVTIPSQRRYISYFGFFCRNDYQYVPKTILLNSVTFVGVPTINSGTCSPSLIICQTKVILHKSKTVEVQRNQSEIEMDIGNSPIPICGDIKIDVFHKDIFKKERMLVFWFNTYFVEYGVTLPCPNGGGIRDLGHDENGDIVKEYIIHKKDLDKANKDKKHKLYPETFAVRLNITIPKSDDNASEVDGKGKSTSINNHSIPPDGEKASLDGFRVGGDASDNIEKHQSASLKSSSNRNIKDNVNPAFSTYPRASNSFSNSRNENSTFYFSSGERSRVITDNTRKITPTKGLSHTPPSEKLPRDMSLLCADLSHNRLSHSIEDLDTLEGRDQLSDDSDDEEEMTI